MMRSKNFSFSFAKNVGEFMILRSVVSRSLRVNLILLYYSFHFHFLFNSFSIFLFLELRVRIRSNENMLSHISHIR